jgi:RecB family exonuclease
VEIAGVILTGQVDLWFEGSQGAVLVDYKTDREPSPNAIAAYSLQLQLYAIALSEYLSRPPERAVLFFLRDGREVDVDTSPLGLGAAREAVHRLASAQSSGDFPLHTSVECGRCEFYRGLCPAGRVSPAAAD